MPLKIEPSHSAHSQPGDFAARVAEDRLVLPVEIAGALESLSVRTTEDLLSYLDSFPTAVASALSWRVPEVEQAHQVLVRQLSGTVDQALLDPEPAPAKGLGALPPDLLNDRE